MSSNNGLTVEEVARNVCSTLCLSLDQTNQCLATIESITDNLELNNISEVNCQDIDDEIRKISKEFYNACMEPVENKEIVLKFLSMLENRCYFFESALHF